MIIEAIKFAIEAIKLELDATTAAQLSESTEALCHAKDVLQHALSYASKSGWEDLTDEESMTLMLDKKDAPFDLVAAVQERLREKNA
jgi:hypothetical protein